MTHQLFQGGQEGRDVASGGRWPVVGSVVVEISVGFARVWSVVGVLVVIRGSALDRLCPA